MRRAGHHTGHQHPLRLRLLVPRLPRPLPRNQGRRSPLGAAPRRTAHHRLRRPTGKRPLRRSPTQIRTPHPRDHRPTTNRSSSAQLVEPLHRRPDSVAGRPVRRNLRTSARQPFSPTARSYGSLCLPRDRTNSDQLEKGKNPMSQNQILAALSAAGVSVWLDDLSRDRLNSGNLAELRDTKCVVGVTTNPSIFQAALSAGNAYDEQIAELADARRRRRGDDPHRHHRRCAGGLRPVRRGLPGDRRCGRPGVDRGGSAVGARHRQDDPAGHRAVEDRRPAQPADQDPGH